VCLRNLVAIQRRLFCGLSCLFQLHLLPFCFVATLHGWSAYLALLFYPLGYSLVSVLSDCSPSLELMRTNHFANLALILVPIGWLLAYYGVMSQLGDPHPDLPRADVETMRDRSQMVLAFGVTCLLASLWLAGTAFTFARIRSLVAASLVLIPFVVLCAGVI
jgi:hypothetical protein